MLSSHLLTAVINLEQALARSSCSCLTVSIPLHRVYPEAPTLHKHLWEGLAWVHLHARKMSGAGRKPAIHVSLNVLIFVSSDSNDLLGKKKIKKKIKESSITPFPPLHPLWHLITAGSQGTIPMVAVTHGLLSLCSLRSPFAAEAVCSWSERAWSSAAAGQAQEPPSQHSPLASKPGRTGRPVLGTSPDCPAMPQHASVQHLPILPPCKAESCFTMLPPCCIVQQTHAVARPFILN